MADIPIGAARVFVTLGELAAALGLPEGHRIEALSLMPDDYRPGIFATIVGRGLQFETGAPCPLVNYTLQQYLALPEPQAESVPRGTGPKPLDVCLRRCGGLLRLRIGGLYCDKCAADAWGNLPTSGTITTYTPAVAPVAVVVSNWPTFPGQDLDYRGVPDAPAASQGDPGDEDIHTGGPR